MATGVSNYIGRVGLDSSSGNMPDTTGFNMSGSGNPDRAQTALLDVHSQALTVIEAFLGNGVTLVPPGGGKVIVSNTLGQADWGDVPPGALGTTVSANTTYARASSLGVSTAGARADHDHGMPGEVKEIYFPFSAVASPTIGTYKYRVKRPSTLLSVRAVIGTVASSGLDIIFDVNVNGASVIASGRPQITVGKAISTNAQTFLTTALKTDDLISVDIDQGSDGFQVGVIIEIQATSPVSGAGFTPDTSWLNVMNFGAKGDNSTDDLAVIQAVIDASPTGATIVFPPGTYLVSAPIKYRGDRVYRSVSGLSRNQETVIKLKNSSNPTAAGGVTAVFVPTNWDTAVTGAGAPVEFLGLGVDGNKANNGSGQHSGILMWDSFWSKIEECTIYNCKLDAITLTDLAKNGTTPVNSTASENRIKNNKLSSCDRDGIRQVPASGSHQDVECKNNKIDTMGARGINVTNGAGWEIAGNHLYSIQTDGIWIGNGWYACDVHNNYVEDFGNQNTAAATYRGIYMKGFAGRGARCSDNHVTCAEPTANASTYYYFEWEAAPGGGATALLTALGNIALGSNTAGTRVGLRYNTTSGTLLVTRHNVAFNMTTPSQTVGAGTTTSTDL